MTTVNVQSTDCNLMPIPHQEMKRMIRRRMAGTEGTERIAVLCPKRGDAAFKTKIILELLREEKQLGDIAHEHGISPNQLRNWKKEFLENVVKVFSESKHEKELRDKERSTG